MDEYREFCARRVIPQNPPKLIFGSMLFPMEEGTILNSLPISRSDIKKSFMEMAETYEQPFDQFISPVLFCCVSYRSTLDGLVHKTAIIANLHRLDPANPNMSFAIDTSMSNVPASLLTLEPDFRAMPTEIKSTKNFFK